jgi:hypothetical protein
MGLGPGYFVSCRIDVLLVDSPFKHPFAFTSRNADNICSVNYTHLHAQTVPIPGAQDIQECREWERAQQPAP